MNIKNMDDHLKLLTFNDLLLKSKTSFIFQLLLTALFITSEVTILNFKMTYFALIGIFSSVSLRYLSFTHFKLKRSSYFYFNLAIFISGISWSLLLYQYNLSSMSPLKLTFTYFILAGLTASSLYSLGSTKIGFYIFNFTLISLVNLSAIHLNNYEFEYIKFAIISVLYLMFLIKIQNANYKLWVGQIESNYELKSIIDSFPGAISVIKNNTYQLVNKRLMELSGIKEEEIINKPVGYQDKTSEFANRINEFLNSNNNEMNYKLKLKTLLGDRFHLVIANRFSTFSSSQNFVIASIDIQELHDSQQKIHDQQTQLIESSKLATIGELSTGIAHEISNPLAAIQSKAQIIIKSLERDNYDIGKVKSDAEKIVSICDRIYIILKSLRNISRDSAHEEFQLYSLSQIISESISLSESKIKQNDVEIFKNFNYQLPSIECLPVQLSQVFINAISNSIDAIEKQKDKWIKIEVIHIDDFLKIKFIDSGGGIPESIRESILKPFFTTKGIGKGTGVGLSLSKSIIETHHGKFYFDHEEKNTTLIIELPLKQPIEKHEKEAS